MDRTFYTLVEPATLIKLRASKIREKLCMMNAQLDNRAKYLGKPFSILEIE